MPLSHARIAINNTTPTLLTFAGREVNPGTSLTLQVQNLGTNAVYIGGAGLTSTSYGVSVVAGGAVVIDDLTADDEVYALDSTGASYVAVLRMSR